MNEREKCLYCGAKMNKGNPICPTCNLKNIPSFIKEPKGTVKPDKGERVEFNKELAIFVGRIVEIVTEWNKDVYSGEHMKWRIDKAKKEFIPKLRQAIAGETMLDEVRFNEEIFDILNEGVNPENPPESITSLTYKVIKEVNRQLKQKLLEVKQ